MTIKAKPILVKTGYGEETLKKLNTLETELFMEVGLDFLLD